MNIFDKKINRLQLWIASIVVVIPLLIVFYTSSYEVPDEDPLITVALLTLMAIIGFFLAIWRVNDIGISRWWVLASFVPVLGIGFNLYLLCKPGRKSISDQ